MGWHAIFVETGKEDFVCSTINSLLKHSRYENNYELLVPKRKIQERHQGQLIEVIIKMFPGYVLIRTDNAWGIYNMTRRLEHLYRFLNHNGEIEEICLDEISNIIYMVDKEGVIGISNIFVKNDMVKVIDGPLCKYTGWIKKVDRHKRRVKVLFKFDGRDHLIDLSVNFIEKVDELAGKEIPFFTAKYISQDNYL